MSKQCPDAGYRTCELGCCGTSTSQNSAPQNCCTYEPSETVIIVACVVGALVVLTVVLALIMCFTNTQNDRVTRVRPRPRDENYNPRLQSVPAPKPPPPYRAREAPPGYTEQGISSYDSQDGHVVYSGRTYNLPRYNSVIRADAMRSRPPTYQNIAHQNTASHNVAAQNEIRQSAAHQNATNQQEASQSITAQTATARNARSQNASRQDATSQNETSQNAMRQHATSPTTTRHHAPLPVPTITTHVYGPHTVARSRPHVERNTTHIMNIPEETDILQDIIESPRLPVPIPSRIPRRVSPRNLVQHQDSSDDGIVSLNDISNM